MPLVPTLDAPEVEGLAVRFNMSNGKKKITCWVRAAALEKLAGNPDLAKGEFLETFLKHRAALEERASAIFDRGLLDGNSVIIRHENV